MKKLLIISIVVVLLIGIVSASALSVLWKQGISATSPQAAQVINTADQIMEIQTLAQCTTGLGISVCIEGIIERKVMGQVYGSAIQAAGPEVQKIISTYQQLDLYKQAGAELIYLQMDENGIIQEGAIQFSGEKKSEIGSLISLDIENKDISVKKGIEFYKTEDGKSTLSFIGEGGEVNIKGKEFKNIQPQSKSGIPTYIKIDKDGNIVEAYFTTNENGGIYTLGGSTFVAPPNSRVYYNKESGKLPNIKLAENSEINLLLDSENYPNLQGEVYYEGENFKIGDNEIKGLDGNLGKVSVSNGKIIRVWKDTDAIVDGIQHKTFKNDLNLYYDEGFDASSHSGENYFNYGKDKIWLGGDGFSSTITENNNYGISLVPDDLENSITKQLRMERNLIFSPKKGQMSIEKVSKEGEQLSLFMRSKGGFSMENGNYEILSEKRTIRTKSGRIASAKNNIYVRLRKESNILQDNMNVATDMRLEYLDKNIVRIYDMNTGKSTTKEISSDGINTRKKELSELKDLRNYLKDRESQKLLKDLNFNKYSDWNNIYDYVDLQILERENEIKYGKKLINPVFGEVISNDNVKISSSNFFSSPIVRKGDLQYFGGADKYTGAAFIIAAESGRYDPAFGIAAQISAKDLAGKGYYVMKMEGIISEYPDFFNILENPNLHNIGDDIKIKKFEIYSHSWSSGLWLDHGGVVLPSELENDLGFLGKKDLYYRYLSKGGLRNINFKFLEPEQIKYMKNNFAKGAEFSYKGCNVGNFPSMGTSTYDTLEVKVEASPVGTYMQKFDSKQGVWTAFELDEKGNIIYSDKYKKIYNQRANTYETKKIRAPKEKIFREGDKVRMYPNIHLLERNSIQKNLPGITGYLTIIDSEIINGEKYYRLEYPTKKGINKVWVDEYGSFVK